MENASALGLHSREEVQAQATQLLLMASNNFFFLEFSANLKTDIFLIMVYHDPVKN